jgi:phage shock protein C
MNTNQQYYVDPRRTHRLYRDSRRGMIFGVCAGIAEYFAFDLRITRVLTFIGSLFAFPLIFASYLVLAIMLPRKPESDVYDPVQKQVRSDPHEMLSGVRYRFRDLDSRLQRLEKYVTSSRFDLDSEFRRLKD